MLQAVFDCDTYQNTAHQKNVNENETLTAKLTRILAEKMRANTRVALAA